MDDYSFIEKNILTVSDKIYAAAKRAGRDPKDITLICVSKTKPVEMVAKAYECGRRDFGENKVQEITLKHPQLPSDTVWHMIGHLQKNKVKKAVALSEYIHSVDSAELAQAIDSEAGKIGKKQKILLEVNIADEDTKYGVSPDALEHFVCEIADLKNIEICGLMCVAPYTDKPEENRAYFRKMNDLLIDINAKSLDNVHMELLSMGMSNDYEIAVEEGATHVRIGTDIFGERVYTK